MVGPPSSRPRLASALLWGAVGSLSFLVLVQGYALAAAPLLSIGRAALVALAVGAAAAAGAYLLEGRIAAWAADRAQRDS